MLAGHSGDVVLATLDKTVAMHTTFGHAEIEAEEKDKLSIPRRSCPTAHRGMERRRDGTICPLCCRRPSRTTAMPGRWSSTTPPAPAATPASSPARRRTTSRSSGPMRSTAIATCIGCVSTATCRRKEGLHVGFEPVPCMHCEHAPVRAGLPGRGLHPRRRRAERPSLQPLHRNALLPGQLPVQGTALQLVRLCRRPRLRRHGCRHHFGAA